ncbi:MAG TPA: response regulator [Polyangiaceae bacterium]|jgi:CheY-like chemotaxis protein
MLARSIEQQQRQQQHRGGTSARRPRVLCADDCPSTRALYRGVFGAEGFDFDEACDGTSAVGKVTVSRPDVVVLDFQMPGMDGGEALRLLARCRATRHIPVVIATATPDAVPKEVRVLAAAIVAKPCDPDEVVAVVRALVPRSKVFRAE